MNENCQQIGHYDILDTLGQGGMGVVYKARNRTTGTIVALKTVKVPNASLLDSIRREIFALARLEHPGIVSIIDSGLHHGLPWYAMELVHGKTMSQFWRAEMNTAVTGPGKDIETGALFGEAAPLTFSHPQSWWTQSLTGPDDDTLSLELSSRETGSLPTTIRSTFDIEPEPMFVLPDTYLKMAMTILRRLSLTLAFLHGAGIIHRDLKPDNVIVKQNGMPVLVDFGLMVQFGGDVSREILRVDAGSVGTLNFMAPEQIRGDFVDSRADLYSLGCIFYEMLTGRPPFSGSSVTEVINAHLQQDVTPPSKLVLGIPPEIDLLILHLLDKKPGNRLGFTDDVALELDRLGADTELPQALPVPRSYLFRPAFSGRTAQLNTAMREIDGLRRDKGKCILVGGESGVGKTRFAMEVGRQTAQNYGDVKTGECTDRSEQPLEAFKNPLRSIADRCRQRGEPHAHKIFGPRAQVLSHYEPTILELPGLQNYPDPPEVPAEAAVLRLFNYLWETLKISALEQPMLCILDDLHWADELTLGFMGYLLRNKFLDNVPLVLIGTYRTEELNPDLEKLVNSEYTVSIVLERLEQEDIERIIAHMLALFPAPPSISAQVARHSEGNPFFVAEFLRTAVDEGLLWRDQSGTWQILQLEDQPDHDIDYSQFPLPRSLKDLVNRRIDKLPGTARTLLTYAALIATEIRVDLLFELFDDNEATFFEMLDELQRRQILQTVQPNLLKFDHNKIREITLEAIPPQHAPDLHRNVARAIEKIFAHNLQQHYAALGTHWKKAGNAAKAQSYFLLGARKARKDYIHAESEKLYRAFLELMRKPTPKSIAVRYEFGKEVLQFQGKYQDAFQEHSQAIEEARNSNDTRGEALNTHALGIVLWINGDLEQSKHLLEQALELYKDQQDLLNQASIISSLAVFERDLSDSLTAVPILNEAITLLEKLDAPQQLSQALANMAILQRDIGDLDSARELCLKALEINRQQGDKRSEGITLCNLAAIPWDLGQFEKAQEIYHEALTVLEPIGDRRAEAVVRTCLANINQELGNLERAHDQFNTALTMHREVGELRWEAYTLQGFAMLYRRKFGETEQSNRMLNQALGLFQKFSMTSEQINCYCQLGHNALCNNQSAEIYIKQATVLAEDSTLATHSDIKSRLDHLTAAQETFEKGKHNQLVRGELISTISHYLLEWYLAGGVLTPDRIDRSRHS